MKHFISINHDANVFEYNNMVLGIHTLNKILPGIKRLHVNKCRKPILANLGNEY